MQLGLAMGLVLSVVLVAVLQFASGLFTEDAGVLHLISVGIPVSPFPGLEFQDNSSKSSETELYRN